MQNVVADLRRLGAIEVGDKVIRYRGEWALLKPGDKYIGQKEGEVPEVLTMRNVQAQKRATGIVGKVFAKERNSKLYDLHDVVKVDIVDNPNPPKETSNVQAATPMPGLDQPSSSRNSRKANRKNRRPRDDSSGKTDYRNPTLRSITE